MADEVKNKVKNSGFLTIGVFRDISVVLLILILGWKLINADLKIDLSSFSFTDLLTLVLALFSVGLSVAFYFKATETSNRFYDNSYKFTKEMSEILGRIEAGFGERLRHLDEGYCGIREKVERLPYGSPTSEDVKKEEDEVKKRESEQLEMLEDLAKRAKLAEGEKQEIFAKLASKSEELDQARAELRNLRSRFHASRVDHEQRQILIEYLAKRLKEASPVGPETEFSSKSIRQLFERIREELDGSACRDLERFGLLDEDGDLRREAVLRLRNEMRRI